MSDAPFTLHQGSTPLLVSIPHTATALPEEVRERYHPRALVAEDADWNLHRLYGFVRDLGASLLLPGYARYLIDLNRPPDNTPMYPGANNTALCPMQFFTGDSLYRDGQAPDAAEIERRRARYWQPYHDALAGELARIKARHGHVVLFDAHSIKSEVPWLFTGRLPDLNLGTADGQSCAPSLRGQAAAVLARAPGFSHVVDGRWKGGYITRHYGQPDAGVHALQLEMCMRCYMDEAPPAPYVYDPEQALQIRPVLRAFINALIAWRPDGQVDTD